MTKICAPLCCFYLLLLFFFFLINCDTELHVSHNYGILLQKAVFEGKLCLLAQLSREALPHRSDSLA